jgi:hypothetical protein
VSTKLLLLLLCTLFSRLLTLTLIFLGIIVNLLPLYRLSYFVFCFFNYFCVFICTRANFVIGLCAVTFASKNTWIELNYYYYSQSDLFLLQDRSAHVKYETCYLTQQHTIGCIDENIANLGIQIYTCVDGQNVRGGSIKLYLKFLGIVTCISDFRLGLD